MIKGFDRKDDYACLSVFPDFLYWLLKDFYCNWLEPPPGFSYTVWINTFAEIMGNFLDIRVAARSLFTSKALWLAKKMRSEQTCIYPTLWNVYHVIRKTKCPVISHTARYKETILNRLEGIFNVFSDHVCSNKRLNWDAFFTTDWIISISGIPTDFQNLFISVIIAKIMLYRIANNQRSKELVDLIVFDEASTVFRKWHETREGTYLLTDYLAQAREFGIGFIIGTQNLSNLADSVMSNTAIKIAVGGFGLAQDYEAFAGATGMNVEQKEYLKQLTRPGQACGRDPRYPYPFILEVPRIA